jgi:hypothetical protein
MSKYIDLTEPLSDEDRAYLEARDRWADIAMSDAVNSGQEFSESMLTAGPITHHDTQRLGPNTGDVNTLGREVLSADSEETEISELENEFESDGYDELKVAELDALLHERELPKTGSKTDKIERLREFDSEQDSDDDEDDSDEDPDA